MKCFEKLAKSNLDCLSSETPELDKIKENCDWTGQYTREMCMV